VAEFDDPVMIVVGGGAITLSTAQELCALQGHRVVVLWRRDPDFAGAVKSIGAEFVAAARPDSAEGLNGAGVQHAVSILALSSDDQLNLHAALLARDANARIRIVLRQFNQRSVTRSSRISQTVQFYHLLGTRRRPMPRLPSTLPAFAGCSFPSQTAR
jgi:Trk K+ transport system NAD-binding subunit